MSGAVEDLGFLTWRDPLAWTEDPEHFKEAATKETRSFHRAVGPGSKRLAQSFATAAAAHIADLLLCWPRGPDPLVLYRPSMEGGGVQWTWPKRGGAQPAWRDAADLDVFFTHENKLRVVYTTETTTGSQAYKVVCRSPGRIAWIGAQLIGPDCAEFLGRVYVLEQKSPLRYTRLVSLDAETGQARKLLYECVDPEWQLRLVKTAGVALFLLEERAGEIRCHWISATGIQRLAPNATVIRPIGCVAGGSHPILAIRETIDAPWKIHGAGWRLSPEIRAAGLEFALPEGILVSRRAGRRQVWRISGEAPQFLGEFLGGIVEDPLSWKPLGHAAPRVWVTAPGSTIRCLSIGKNSLRAIAGTPYARISRGTVVSSDGTEVGWVLVRPRSGESKGLVVCAYGAYGLPTKLSTARWEPWIAEGWAIGFALVRGGGDDTDAWAAAGRLGGKERGIDDYEAVILHLQTLTSLGPERTCLYGRSAGGLMVGGIAARHPAGGLARRIYAEVPYVDMLKTAEHRDLPLTPAEFREFGNPAAGPAEFNQVLESSPIHRLGPAGAPGLRVVCRTGIFDIQVYPYESLKWILQLRGGREGQDDKWLSVDATGHFSQGQTRFHSLAEDMLLLTRPIEENGDKK